MRKQQLDRLVSKAYQIAREYSDAVAKAEAAICGNEQRLTTPENVGAFLKASYDIYSVIPAEQTPVHELLLAFGWVHHSTVESRVVGKTHYDTEHIYKFWKCEIVVEASVGWHCLFYEPSMRAGQRKQKLHGIKELASYLNRKMPKLLVEQFLFQAGAE